MTARNNIHAEVVE